MNNQDYLLQEQYKTLGKTDIRVSPICFGTLTVGPLQANLPIKQGGQVIATAIEHGINFFDTAELYETYPYLKQGMKLANRQDIVISSKTYAYTRELAVAAVEQARKELSRDYIDIFMLHEQESIHTLNGHAKALEYLYECVQSGVIRAVGASMHTIAAVEGAVSKGLDVIHPLVNMKGLGVVDGDGVMMESAVRAAHNAGIGVFSMKALGGGNLYRQATDCFNYVYSLDCVDSVAIGMQSDEEVISNIRYYNSRVEDQTLLELRGRTRRLHIDDHCVGCGLCVKRCGQSALSVVDGQAVCDHKRCILCGYCGGVCKEFCIKVV